MAYSCLNFQRAPEGMSHDSYIWDLGEGRTRQRPGALAGRDRDRRRPLTAPLSGVQAQPDRQTREQETRFISRSVIRVFKTRPHKVPIVGPRRAGQIESQQPEKGPGLPSAQLSGCLSRTPGQRGQRVPGGALQGQSWQGGVRLSDPLAAVTVRTSVGRG